MAAQVVKHDYSALSETGQIPLCMIGDSITWAEFGDHWRKELLKHLPGLAFIGSHTACFGYSHAGEGGNNTNQVLARMDEIPDCPYYSLLIGTNNNSVTEEAKVMSQAEATAAAIIEIVNKLLSRESMEKVFLSSLMPCCTDNLLRDVCNHETSKILREKFTEVFPADKVVWVEYEEPVHKIVNWEEIVLLHPTPEGYAVIAEITAKAIAETLNIRSLKKVDNTGVQVVNLMGDDNGTDCKIIAGWYTLSLKVDGENPNIKLRGQDQSLETPFNMDIPVKAGKDRVCKRFFTEAAGYGYTQDYLVIEAQNCSISEVLLEKMRPSRQASIYNNKKSYIDTVSPFSNGELLEYKKRS
jgi:GDSL-like Lipase/Acylhydrolase family